MIFAWDMFIDPYICGIYIYISGMYFNEYTSRHILLATFRLKEDISVFYRVIDIDLGCSLWAGMSTKRPNRLRVPHLTRFNALPMGVDVIKQTSVAGWGTQRLLESLCSITMMGGLITMMGSITTMGSFPATRAATALAAPCYMYDELEMKKMGRHFILLALYSGGEEWEGIWNQTQSVVLNFCLERLHHVTISHDKARWNRWCQWPELFRTYRTVNFCIWDSGVRKLSIDVGPWA